MHGYAITRGRLRIVVLLRSVAGSASLAKTMLVERVLSLHFARLLSGSHQILFKSLTLNLAPLLILSVKLGMQRVGQDIADSSFWRVDLVDVGLDPVEWLRTLLSLGKILHTAA